MSGIMASKLMHRGPYDAIDELENCLLQSYSSLQSQLSPPYQLPSQSPALLIQLNQALLYGMLTQPQTSQSLVTHLAAITTDGYISFVSIILRLINESYLKILDQPRGQLIWLLRQLIELSASDVDNLCLSLLRHVIGGDLSQGNLWLAAQLLDVFQSNWKWLTGNAGVLTSALFTYLRILPDQCMAKNSTINELKQNEITFCVQIIRDCFQDCLVIGRDLVRLLQDVSGIPEFEPIWKDLLSNPAAFKAPFFTDIAQLYVVRTPTRYLLSRLTPEMEAQIRFMLTHVRWGSQRRYQTWFAQRFLSTSESETLVCDLIRFICCVHHPSNQILQSDIVPRWAIVGWLLKCCKSKHVEANAKLSLFYDWLFFMSKTDNIMNIEPALLLMVHSIPKYIDMTHSLLDYLFLLMEHYDPTRRDLVHRGVMTSVDILVGKGVVRSLEPLSASNLVAPWLREKLIAYFPAYCKSDSFDSMKITKHELLQHESFSPTPISHVTSTVKNSVPASVADQSLAGVNAQSADSVGISNHDSRANEVSANAMHFKRRRIDAMTVDNLVEALTISQEAAMSALERLLISFLSGHDHFLSNKNKDPVKVEAGFDSKTEYSMENTEKFTRQITDALKSSGYDLFMSLNGALSNTVEKDEILSLTSVILRLYVESRHPQILQMLLFWCKESFDVGARLLCYACRLADEIEQPTLSSVYCKSSAVKETGPGSETAGRSLVKIEGEPSIGSYSSKSINREERYCLKSNGETGAETKLEGISPLLWHTGFQTKCMQEFWKEGQRGNSKVPTDMQVSGCFAVSNAFGAYKEYLREVKNRKKSSQTDELNQVDIAQKSRLANGINKVEGKDEEEGLESVLLGDLETCLVWNVRRLLSVFPWVFKYLSNLSAGKEEILHLLVSIVDPTELSQLELKLSLKEISVLAAYPDSVARLINHSLQWDCFEQQYLWRLISAELQNVGAFFAIDFVKCCAAFLDPSRHSEAMSGLLLYLRPQRPTVQLVSTMVFLPREFGRFAAAVLASWVVSDIIMVFESLNELIEQNVKNGQERMEGFEHKNAVLKSLNISAVSDLFTFFENHVTRNNAVDEKVKGKAIFIKCALLELAGVSSPKSTAFVQQD